MKVWLGSYTKHKSPYSDLGVLPISDNLRERLAEWLHGIDWVIRFYKWRNSRRGERCPVIVHIDDYDVWGVGNTLSYIVVPMLERLIEKKNGSPYVDPLDVPQELRDYDDPVLWHERWDYVCTEILYAWKNVDSDEAYADHDRCRVENGLMLFAKYLHCLWD